MSFGEWLSQLFSDLGNELYTNLIAQGRWKYYVDGLGQTLLITLGAALIGIILGCIVAILKTTAKERKIDRAAKKKSFRDFLWKVINFICDVYLTVIRGTPMVVQLLIFSFVIFASASFSDAIYIAILAFGVNSGAYVAEIVRAGINAVSRGQFEAGRSLGLNGSRTMRLIILPQAIKNILPALTNEAIVLLKETSVVGYIAISDITYAATLVRSRTFSAVPLLAVAVVYLILVMFMTWGLRKLERRLARSDRH